jgi:hypothetical protein
MTTELKIKKTSAKGAHLLTDGTVEFWVKPSCVRADGTFTPSVENAYKDALKLHEKEADFISKFGKVKFWTPDDEKFRIYLEDGTFVAGARKESAPEGYYERHRYAKGIRQHIVLIYEPNRFSNAELWKLCFRFLDFDRMVVKRESGWEKVN